MNPRIHIQSARTGNCNQGRQCKCDLTSELIPESKPTGRPRMGGLRGWERAVLYRRPTHTVAAVVALSILCVILKVWP